MTDSNLSNPTEEEAISLIEALFENRISRDQARRLQDLVVTNPAIARLYVKYSHLCCDLPVHVVPSAIRPENLVEMPGDDERRRPMSLGDAMVMPALRDEASLAEPLATAPPTPSRFQTIRSRNKRIRPAAIILLPILLTIALWAAFRPAKPAGTLTATADAQWAVDPDALADRGSFKPGTRLQLNSGYAQVRCVNGTDLILEGPCDVRIDSPMLLTLASGRLTAKVAEGAHGFTVATPHGNVVDLGTEFGVSVSGEATEVRVVVGRVQVKTIQNGQDQLVSLAAGDSAKIDASGVNTSPTAVSSTPYATDIHEISAPVAAHPTGQGINEGSVDPNWTITNFEGKTAWQPLPVMVCPAAVYHTGNDARSAWISCQTKITDNSPGGLYTFTTTFDLKNLDPATIRLQMGVGVDDAIEEIRLNGKPTGLTLGTPGRPDSSNFTSFHPLLLDHGFVPGVNRLDVVVWNQDDSPLALHVDFDGTGKQLVKNR